MFVVYSDQSDSYEYLSRFKDSKDSNIFFPHKNITKNIQQIIVSHQNNKQISLTKKKEYMNIQLTQQYSHETSK